MIVLRKLNVSDALRMFTSGNNDTQYEASDFEPRANQYVGISGFPEHLTLIGTGASKWVYDLGDGTVLKVHHPRDSQTEADFGNQIELECINWSNATTDQRNYLAPIIRHSTDYKWSIQVAADKCSRALVKRRAINDMSLALFGSTTDTDMSRSNCGVINGQLVCIDYGYTTLNYTPRNPSQPIGDWDCPTEW